MNHPGLSNELGMKLLEQVRSGRTILPMVSRWTSVKVEAVEYPILLTEMLEEAYPPSSGRRKYIATIYDGGPSLCPPETQSHPIGSRPDTCDWCNRFLAAGG